MDNGGYMVFFTQIIARVQEFGHLKEDFMQKIKDPMISCNGSVYSLAGLKLLLAEVTKGAVGRENETAERKKKNGKI